MLLSWSQIIFCHSSCLLCCEIGKHRHSVNFYNILALIKIYTVMDDISVISLNETQMPKF